MLAIGARVWRRSQFVHDAADLLRLRDTLERRLAAGGSLPQRSVPRVAAHYPHMTRARNIQRKTPSPYQIHYRGKRSSRGSRAWVSTNIGSSPDNALPGKRN